LERSLFIKIALLTLKKKKKKGLKAKMSGNTEKTRQNLICAQFFFVKLEGELSTQLLQPAAQSRHLNAVFSLR
jgi:hypothetical protein